MNTQKQKAVVTGGAGFIGSHIVDGLVDEGFDVHVVDNLSAGKKENVNKNATLHVVDIRDYDTLASIIDGATYVFHEAAVPRVQYSIENPQETTEVNILGTVNVLKASHDGGVKRVVFAASSSAYGDQETLPLVETMDPMPLSPYGLQKYVGEEYFKLFHTIYGLETVSLRYFNVYGSRFDPEGAYALVIGKFLKMREEGKPMTITGNGEQTRDFTHVQDVVNANLLAARGDKVGKGEVINIGAGQNCSVNRIAELIGGPVEHIEARIEPKDTLSDNTRAKELLGWEPTISIEDGIEALKKS